jgi:hypothetical protein
MPLVARPRTIMAVCVGDGTALYSGTIRFPAFRVFC